MTGASLYINLAGLVVLALCALLGFAKGFLSQLISIIAAVTAAVVTYRMQQPAGRFAHDWLSGRFPTIQLDPALVHFGCAVLLFGLVYLCVAALLEALKKRVINALALRMSDRVLGLVTGLAKGLVIVVALVALLDWGNVYAARVMTADGFERYRQMLDNTEVVAGSRYALGVARIYCPALSNLMAGVEQRLPVRAAQP